QGAWVIVGAVGGERDDRPCQEPADADAGQRLAELRDRVEGRVRGAGGAGVQLPVPRRRGSPPQGGGRGGAGCIRPSQGRGGDAEGVAGGEGGGEGVDRVTDRALIVSCPACRCYRLKTDS